MRSMVMLLLLFSVATQAGAQTPAPSKPSAAPPSSVTKAKTTVQGVAANRATGRDTTIVGELREEAIALKPMTKTLAVQAFLDSTRALPFPGSRTLYMDSSRTHLYSESQARALGEDTKAKLISRTLDDTFKFDDDEAVWPPMVWDAHEMIVTTNAR